MTETPKSEKRRPCINGNIHIDFCGCRVKTLMELNKAKAEIEELKNTMAIRELRCKEHERALLEGIKVREKKDVVLELAMNCLKHIRDNYDGSVYSNVTVVLSQIDEALK